MFKSVKDYDDAVFSLLENIRDEKRGWYKTDILSPEDLDDIIEFAIANGLVKGRYSPKEVKGFRAIASNLRITRLGLVFIEQWPETQE